MNKNEKFLLNKINESVDVTPDFNKIINKIEIKKARKQKSLFQFNFVKMALATVLLCGIIIPTTILIDEVVNSDMVLGSENVTLTPSIPTVLESETVTSEITKEESSFIENIPETNSDTIQQQPITLLIENSNYLLIQTNQLIESFDNTANHVIVESYYVYLESMLAYDYINDIWYEMVITN